ncbi:MAG: YdgA family protein [Pseudomonadota bacterium]
MKKSVGIAVGLVVAAGVVGTAGAWYTGNQLEPFLKTSIAESNEALKALLPGTGITPSMELVSFEKGLFTSTARYRLKVVGAVGADKTPVDGELLFVDHIEHGPFPVSRVAKLQLMPVMAKSTFALEPSPLVEKWFALAKGQSPLVGQSSLGYNKDVSGNLQFLPLEFTEADMTLTFSGLDMDFEGSQDMKAAKVDGNMDSLTLVGKDNLRIEFQGLNLASDTKEGKSGLGLGSSAVSLKLINVLAPEQQPVVVKDVAIKGNLGENAEGVFGSTTYDTGMISYAGKDIGSLKMGYSAKNLDITAVKALVDLYKEMLTNIDASTFDANNPDFDLSAEQKAQLETTLGTLLAGKPVVALDTLTLKTANGESRFNLSVGLSKPSSYELPPQALLMEGLASLDARLVVSKAMIKDVMLLKDTFEPSGDPAAAQAEAEQMAEMAGGMAVGMQMATLEGSDIVANLNYAAGQVDFNGRKMPVEEFLAMAMGMVPGGAGGMTGAEEEAEGESYEETEEAEEAE